MVIGHVIPTSWRHEMVNPIFGDFIAGASEAYAQRGYDMMVSRVDDGRDDEAYAKLARNGAVDGVVIQGPSVDDPRIAQLYALGLPFAVHGRSTGVASPYPWVDVNNRRAFERATGLLLQLGHRRIALLNGHEHMDFAKRRREGYLRALSEAGVSVDPALMCSAEMTESYGYAETQRLLRAPDPPTAILVSSLISAIGVRRAIQDAGLRLGREVSVITHDDDLSYLKNGADVPLFTATRSSVREAGRLLGEMLIALIEDPATEVRSRLMEAELVVGASTGPVLERVR
jgi:LacI family transcriptional regulator